MNQSDQDDQSQSSTLTVTHDDFPEEASDSEEESQIFRTPERLGGRNNVPFLDPAPSAEETGGGNKQAKMFACHPIPQLQLLPDCSNPPADAVYGNAGMDVDSIVLVSLLLYKLLEALQVDGSIALFPTLRRHTNVNRQSKLYVKSTPPADANSEYVPLRPTVRGRSRPANCPVHWFRNNQFMQVKTGGKLGLTFYVSVFVMDPDYIRKSPAYLTNHHIAALNAAFNAARTDYTVFPEFQKYDDEQKIRYHRAMPLVNKFVANAGPMTDEYGGQRPSLDQVVCQVDHHVYPDFAEIAHQAMKELALIPQESWRVKYLKESYHGFDVGIGTFKISVSDLQSAARDIYENGLYVAQAVGTKQTWQAEVKTTQVVNMSVPAELNQFATQALTTHVGAIVGSVVNRPLITKGKVVMYADIALTVHPTMPGTSFLLDGHKASDICIRACALTNDDFSPESLAALRQPAGGVHDIGNQQLTTWVDPNADIALPGLPAGITFSNRPPVGTDQITGESTTRRSNSSDFPLLDDAALAEAAEHNNGVYEEQLQLEVIETESQLRRAKLFSQYGTHHTIANVQHNRPYINYYKEWRPDADRFIRHLKRGLPPDRAIAAAQIYMPETRLLPDKKSYKSVHSHSLSIPKNIQKFFEMYNSGVSSYDDRRQLYRRAVTQVKSLVACFNTTAVNGKSADGGHVRFEYSFMDFEMNEQNSSGPEESEVVKWFMPIHHEIVPASAILVAQQSEMRRYLEEFMKEHVKPLESVFREEYVSLNAIPDFTAVSDSIKTAMVYHAETLLSFNEFAPDYQGVIFRLARNSREAESKNWTMRRLPIEDLKPVDPATHPGHVTASYGIDPKLLPILRGMDYQKLPKLNKCLADAILQSECNIRHPSLYNYASRRLRHLVMHFSLAQKRAGIRNLSYGTMTPVNYKNLAAVALDGKEYGRFLRCLCNEFILYYDEYNRMLVNTHLYTRHRAGQRRAAFTTVQAQHGPPPVLTSIPMTDGDCLSEPFNLHFQPSYRNTAATQLENLPIYSVADFILTLFGGSPITIEYKPKSGWDKCPLRRLYLRVYEYFQKTRDCFTRRQAADYPNRFTIEEFQTTLFDFWIENRSFGEDKPILLMTSLQHQHKHIFFYRTIEKRDNLPPLVPMAPLPPATLYFTHEHDAAMQATLPRTDILQSQILNTPSLSFFRLMMARPFFNTVCWLLSRGTQLEAIAYSEVFARQFGQTYLTSHDRVGLFFDNDDKIVTFVKNLNKDLHMKELNSFHKDYINNTFLSDNQDNPLTNPNKVLWRAVMKHLPLDVMQMLVDHVSNHPEATVDPTDDLFVTIPSLAGHIEQRNMLDQIMTDSQDKTSCYFLSAFVYIEAHGVISAKYMEKVVSIKKTEVSLRTELQRVKSDPSTPPAQIEACRKELDQFYAKYRSSGKHRRTDYNRKRKNNK